MGEYFTSGLFCLQRKHLAHEYFLKFVFHWVELLAPRPTLKLEDHPLSAVRDCLFNLFAATLHIGGRSSIRNLRKRHAVVTGTHKHGLTGTFSLNKDAAFVVFNTKVFIIYSWTNRLYRSNATDRCHLQRTR